MLIRTLFSAALLFCSPLYGQTVKAQSSANDFVRSFYDWYAPLAQADHQGPAFQVALKRDAWIFSGELQRALKADAAAQAKVDGEIVGLDFDPFLFSQDPDGRYEIGKVTRDENRQLFALHGVSEGKRRTKPSVLVEVRQQSGRWIFINFYSPEGGDLLSILKGLEEGREKLNR